MSLAAGDIAVAAPAPKNELAGQWRRFGRIATVVAALTLPVLFIWFHNQIGWGIGWSLLAAFIAVIFFRGAVDVASRRFIP